MSISKIDRLIEINARLYDAIESATESERWVNPACEIPRQIEHSVWRDIKYNIHPSLMLWQLAYLAYPYADHWKSQNPVAKNKYFNKRNFLIYYLIHAIENDPVYIAPSLPPEITDIYQIERSTLEAKAQIKISFESYKKLIKSGLLDGLQSRWLRVWVAWMGKVKKPKIEFSPPPEPVHVRGYFNSQPFYATSSHDELLGLSETTAPHCMGIDQVYVDSYQYWKTEFYCPPIKEHSEMVGEIIKNNLSINVGLAIQPSYMMGEKKPELMNLSDYLSRQKTKRQSTVERNEEWNDEIIRRWDADTKYKSKIEVCRDIVRDMELADDDDIPTAKHIDNMTDVTSRQLKARRKVKTHKA